MTSGGPRNTGFVPGVCLVKCQLMSGTWQDNVTPNDEPSPERVEKIFHEACDLSGSERAAFLIESCAGDEPLRGMVENLLRAADESSVLQDWETPAIMHVARSFAWPGPPVLDRYRVTGKLGTGGMGVVYRAERCDGEYSKEVAIKIIPWAAGDDGLLERFRTERSILARLNHPNIAGLLDGGATADGLPYFAMEVAEGVPIDEYVKEEKPSPRELVELFRRVCGAVSYAHRNLIVHRDLKPGNILVFRGPNGVANPKLLDFGVAKLLDESDAATRTRALTPEYASPEQISGAPVTTASDVYSLGVLLYELVTGRRPYRVTTGVIDLATAICKEEPVEPGPECDADLAKIALMALRKEPERRYASVEQMSEDLRRWLDGYPVSARPDARTYRARKFLGRNKVAVAIAAAFVVAIAGGVAATLRQAGIAERRFNDVRKLANSYLFEFDDSIKELPGSTAARQLVVNRGLEYLDHIARERAGDRALTLELAAAYTKIGDVQGRVDVANLGEPQAALASYGKAAELYKEVLARGRDADAALGLADTQAKSARILQNRGDLAKAEKLAREGIEIVETYAPVSKAARDILPGYYVVLGNLAGNPSYPNLGHAKLALELYQKALAGMQALARERPGDDATLRRLSAVYNRVGQMYQALGDGEAAVSALRSALDIQETLLKKSPGILTDRNNVAIGNNNLAVAYTQVLLRPRDAQPLHERALPLFRELAAADAKDVQAKLNLMGGLYAAARTELALGNSAQALEWANESVAEFEAVCKLKPDQPPAAGRTAYQVRADILIARGDLAAAAVDIRRQLEIDEALLRTYKGDASAQRNLAIAWEQMGSVHVVRAKRTASNAEWRQALAWFEKADDMYATQVKQETFIAQYARARESVRKNIVACREALKGR